MIAGRVDMGADEGSEKPGDFTHNGKIDYEDIDLFAESWLSGPSDNNWYRLCDLEENSRINFADYADVAKDWLWQATWYQP